ncbi:MAG: hypothetical protein DWP97_07775 [Calditrichaeota bacterium]|nr:MAG: hypothetical protein DWP97_07775 [Calditrichota bacterium]
MTKKLKTVTTINGKFVKRGDDKISVFDNSLLYAEGLFETFLAVENEIVFLKEHLNRLYKGAKVMGLKIPVDKSTLQEWMLKTVDKHPDRIKKLRLTLTSGEAARWVGVQGQQQVILSASPHTMPTKPFRLHVSEFRVDQNSVFRRIKTLSYAIHAVALSQAKKMKCDDALLLNEKNHVAEVTSANIFWLSQGKIYTPPIDAGCLEGITRSLVFKISKKLKLPIIEKNCTLKTLLKADEIFISSSLKLVIPVSEILFENKLHKLPRGKVSQQIRSEFAKLLHLP